MNNIDTVMEKYITESKWKNLPDGWTEESVKKFAKSLTNKEGTAKGFFDACVKKMQGNIDNPEAFCATVKDTLWHSTYWRGKDKSKAEIKKSIKAHEKE